MNRICFAFLLVVFFAGLTVSQNPPVAGLRGASQTVMVLPFENHSKAPGLEWISESFPEVLGVRLKSPTLYIIGRDERLYAFERIGVPNNAHLSRATLYRMAEQMELDYVVLGWYSFDGQSFTAAAQLLDMKTLGLTSEVRESGPLVKLIDVQRSLAWDLMSRLRPNEMHMSRQDFLASTPPVRLDAFENYMRGVMATTRAEKVRYLRETLRLNPSYTPAIQQLARSYFQNREYESAASWYARVPKTDPMAGEASFYLGLAAYYVGDFERAESAFRFLASHLPLTEVYNNLGVVAARRGKRLASEYFLKAVQADPNDPDYHFNLALALYRAGDAAGAARQLRETLNLRASDGEARTLLNIIVSNASSALNAHPVDAAQPRLPMERIKRNYDETSYRRLALDIQNAAETRLAQADPRVHGEYHVEQGRALLAQGFVPDAEKEFREAIILDPTNAAAHLGLARALEEKGEPAVARDEARTAVRLQPSAEAYLVLARLDLRENNLKPASDSVERALALEPSNNVALALRRTISGKMTEQAPQSQSVPR